MSLKRVIYMLLSLTTLLVVMIAALSTRTEQAAASVQAERPTWGDAFIQDYEAKHGEASSELEFDLLAGANASCGDLVAKNNLSQVWQMNVDRGMSSDQSATVIELAVQYYCPQYRYLFTGPYVPEGM